MAMWYGISNTRGLGTLKKNMARIVLRMGAHLAWSKLDGVGEGGRKSMFFPTFNKKFHTLNTLQ